MMVFLEEKLKVGGFATLCFDALFTTYPDIALAVTDEYDFKTSRALHRWNEC
jgi:hypothetical protein